MSKSLAAIPTERVEQVILLIRGERVILDSDLATLYGVTTARFNQQVRRNAERFPTDFMFELTKNEYDSLMLQFATSKEESYRVAVTNCDQFPNHEQSIGNNSCRAY